MLFLVNIIREKKHKLFKNKMISKGVKMNSKSRMSQKKYKVLKSVIQTKTKSKYLKKNKTKKVKGLH